MPSGFFQPTSTCQKISSPFARKRLISWVLASGLLVGGTLLEGLATRLHAEDLTTSALSRMSSDLEYLSSDDLEGRDSGSAGIRKAAEFIVARFDELGLKTDSFDGTAFQTFQLPGPAEVGAAEKNQLTVTGVDGVAAPKLGEDYTPVSLGSNGSFEGEVVFAGYGITAPDLNYDDYADVDVKGKVVIVLRKEPQQKQEDSVFNGTQSSQFAYFSAKELNAAVHGAAALIMVNDTVTVGDEPDRLLGVQGAGSAVGDQQIPTVYATRDWVDLLLKPTLGKSLTELEQAIDVDLKPQTQVLEGVKISGQTEVVQSQLEVRNVVGFLPGTGNLADEYVVVGAHYDHVGMGGSGSLARGTVAIHNGADDNGSGTTAMMEVARRMSEDTSENRRSLIFMAFTGEEKGLLGSKHYVRNPRWPLEDTVAMVNMDMVGRLTDDNLTIYGIGTGEGFGELVDRSNSEPPMNLVKVDAGFGPSDHDSFYKADIPVFHFFTGLHNDYHRPSDDFETVNLDGMTRIASMVTMVVQELATAPERPKLLKTNERANVNRTRQRPQRAVLGIALDIESDGVRVGSVSEGGPAEAAGLKAQDLVLEIDGKPTPDIGALREVLSEKKPGQTVELKIQRDAESLTITLELGRG